MTTTDIVRQVFEQITVKSFGVGVRSTERNSKGQYIDPIIADHWETFQEGWECGAVCIAASVSGGDKEKEKEILKQFHDKMAKNTDEDF